LSTDLKEEEVASAWCRLDEDERSAGAVTEELRLDGLEVCAAMLKVLRMSMIFDAQSN
jgi:hypothetical protein